MNKIISEHIIKVHNIFKEKKITLSIAESCTGGLISHYITSFPLLSPGQANFLLPDW